MLKRAHPRGQEDDGFVLIMVLLFVAVVGLVTVALLRQTSTSLAAVRVATTNEARVSAVNAGIDVVIRGIEEDEACSLESLTLNSVPVTASCLPLSGPPAPTPPDPVIEEGDDGTVTTTTVAYTVDYWSILSTSNDASAKQINAEASVQYLVTETTVLVVPPAPEPEPSPTPGPPPEAPTPTTTVTETGNLTILSWAISNP
jgi:type II secretory pathway pseudopilin PulG